MLLGRDTVETERLSKNQGSMLAIDEVMESLLNQSDCEVSSVILSAPCLTKNCLAYPPRYAYVYCQVIPGSRLTAYMSIAQMYTLVRWRTP